MCVFCFLQPSCLHVSSCTAAPCLYHNVSLGSLFFFYWWPFCTCYSSTCAATGGSTVCCTAICFVLPFFFNPLSVLQNWLVFQANSEGRVHNVGQQIRASCWLHIASDTPTDRQSYINFPNPHTELPLKTLVSLALFFKKVCTKHYGYITSQQDSQWTACVPCVLKRQARQQR